MSARRSSSVVRSRASAFFVSPSGSSAKNAAVALLMVADARARRSGLWLWLNLWDPWGLCSFPRLEVFARHLHRWPLTAPAPQSQKKRERRLNATAWPTWQLTAHTEQHPFEPLSPHV